MLRKALLIVIVLYAVGVNALCFVFMFQSTAARSDKGIAEEALAEQKRTGADLERQIRTENSSLAEKLIRLTGERDLARDSLAEIKPGIDKLTDEFI